MGKYDDAIYDYFSDNERFADLFNAVLFGGKPVLRGEQLESQPERYVTVTSQKDAAELNMETGLELPGKPGPKTSRRKRRRMPETGSRFRDVRKRAETGEIFVMTAVEAQTDIDYTMPWRIMNYDQMEYGRQIRDIRRQKSVALWAQGKEVHEWDIRLGPEDLLCPIYTICFYHGTEPWDGPRRLRDMMRFEGTDSADIWQQYFHDYGMTLFCAGEAGDLSRFRTDLGQFLEVLAMRTNKKGLEELWNREDFTRLGRDTAEVMAIMTDSTEILEKLDNYETEEGECSMCLAMDELRQDWKAEGEAKERENGIACLVKTIKELGGNMEVAAQQLVAKYSLDETTAASKAKLYW